MNRVLIAAAMVAMTSACGSNEVANAPTEAAQPSPADEPAAPIETASTEEAKGKRLFLRCASCHAATAGAAERIGPHLQGIVGRKAASLPGYNYSSALKAKDFVWDEAHLDPWLERPTALVPGTTMIFAGIPKAEDRKALTAYLRTLNK